MEMNPDKAMDAAPMGKVQALLILIKHRTLVTILFTGFTGMIMTVGPWPAFLPQCCAS